VLTRSERGVAIALPGPKELPPGPKRDFVEALHALYDSAGQPGARVISQYIRHDLELRETVSHETVAAVLRGGSLPAWAKINSIVAVLVKMAVDKRNLGATLFELQNLWLAARGAVVEERMDDFGPGSAGLGAATPVPSPSDFPWPGPAPARAPTPSPHPTQPWRSSDEPPPRAIGPGRAGPAVTATPAAEVRAGPAVARPRQTLDGQIVGDLPGRNDAFIGREILLDRMRTQLQAHPHAPLVLHGIGGVGKTQLACEYLHRTTSAYAVIWWVPADRPARARASLVKLAERLGVPQQAGAEQTVAGLLSRLESGQRRYLLVFDGAEDTEIRSLMPTLGGHVIVTSRDPMWAHESSSVGLEVPDFDRAEAVQFLRWRDHNLSGPHAEKLIQLLGTLPLALEQLTALRVATGRPWEEILDQLTMAVPGLLSAAQPANYPHTVTAALQLALQQLEDANPVAKLGFELFAWLGPEPVSIALLRGGRTGDLTTQLSVALRDPVRLYRAIADISKYGLARLYVQQQRIEVQPMTRLALLDALTEEARQRARHNVHEILAAADPGLPDDLPSWDMHREMAAHILPSGLIHSKVDAAQQAVLHQIRYRYLIGDYADAAHLGQEAVTSWRADDFLGPNHELVLLATREWANALRATGRYQRSRELTAEAMQRLRANPEYGEDHPHTLAMATSLAADQRIAGEYAESLRTDEETHRRSRVLWGEDHPRTLACHHNVAVSLRLTGDFGRAAAIDQQIMQRRPTHHADDHNRTLLSANALAEDLYGLGHYREALELQTPHLLTGQRLAPSYYGVLQAARTVALAQRALGDLADALEALRGHYQRCIETFGPDHEYTLSATISYANTLRLRDRAEEAHVYATDAVGTYRRLFGTHNPLTLAAEVNLATILRARGERNGARHTDTMARQALQNTVGDRHPYTIAATVNLATDLALAGDQVGALTLSQQAYAAATDVRGRHHPDTLAARTGLAMDLRSNGDAAAAETLLAEVLAGLRRTLGPHHPTVMQVASGLRVELVIEPPST
jgi:tetratricopeptide (TPR) repeat protein